MAKTCKLSNCSSKYTTGELSKNSLSVLSLKRINYSKIFRIEFIFYSFCVQLWFDARIGYINNAFFIGKIY